ncbi:TetR/AcrR family transcriptional regulator [Stackebrandtia nassauensis]|uniref:Transcriptional regulator, TetR family n=1 Tax=Stackebrandtia nassauensis (strain DSM 44728 / CIP 108903 / NRRL B-16338 / NBRC 102104 / LLR-40K-21) TaxID=446470 RepID=D3QBL8_STANL|nr:TetR/AcrR family transcriptional regulator [Stackebrandtia nassauensis]ADD42900.1 transcriptional regulator, TetR family [Stackebrandtia nassauensis DSM 44728]
MPTVTPPRLTPAARRVLDVASTLFYERGINTVGMDLIAATAKVTKKTIYDRFGSKEALVTAYLSERDHTWRRHLDAQLADIPGPRAKILASFDVLAAWMGDNYRGCAMVNAYAELADPTHPARAVSTDQKKWLKNLFTDLLTQAGINDEHLAVQLVMLHEGSVVAAYVGGMTTAVAAARQAAATLLDTHGE